MHLIRIKSRQSRASRYAKKPTPSEMVFEREQALERELGQLRDKCKSRFSE